MILDRSVIIVAGGSGSRFNAPVPKQFLHLSGKPVLFYSMEAFHRAWPGITMILVLPAEHMGTWQQLCDRFSPGIPHHTVTGGVTRFLSVKNGLERVTTERLTAVHDGARPLVGVDLIGRCFELAEETGSAIPVIPVAESLRVTDGDGNHPVDRNQYRIVQTPQVFRTDWLKTAYKTAYDPSFTDDATVVERLGYRLTLTEGETKNIKITRPEDIVVAENLL